MKQLAVVFLSVFFVQVLSAQTINTLTAKEEKQGWKLLFNGANLDGWTSVGKDTPPALGWVIEEGVLIVKKQEGKQGGDIITKEEFADFDLMVDFKITSGANSGIKYFFTKYEKGGWLGLEYQLLDDEVHPDAKMGRDGNRLQGGLYDMFPTGKKTVNLIGEWSQARIIAKGTKVEHYLNGKKILTFDRQSDLYKKTWELSKYKDCNPMFGDVKQGRILLQDHGDEVSFRNVKIRRLK